jgi:SAM-dependent methyltransferase
MSDWYKAWFNSPYYHLLYRERNAAEARRFLVNLVGVLEPAPGACVLDQACGRGRHAICLSGMGFDVTGTDLSEDNIAHCRQFASDTLRFHVHDMRRPFREGGFDMVFNIFTSMGYFESDEEQQRVVQSAARSLRPGGWYVIDFLNAVRVRREMVEREEKTVNNIRFSIRRMVDEGFIHKYIRFTDGGREYAFEEHVEAMTLDDFRRYFGSAGLDLKHVYGNYALAEFDPESSPRLIVTGRKKERADRSD